MHKLEHLVHLRIISDLAKFIVLTRCIKKISARLYTGTKIAAF